MKRNVIRYRTKPEKADENQELIEAVFEELADKAPDDVRYLALRLSDNTFIHLVSVETADGSNSIPALTAFKAFQAAIKDRTVEPPQTADVVIVGNYRMLDEY
jgi:hypothetical protein